MKEQDQIPTSFRVARAIYYYNIMSFWPEKYRSYISEDDEQNPQDINRLEHGGLRGQHGHQDKERAVPLDDLRETFSTLTEYRMKLNPTKCTFGVKSRKFLGFITSELGIEVNPHKIKVVLGLAKPRCIKDIQMLNGCIAALGRFVSKSAERCMPFFKSLKLSGKTFGCDES